MIKNHFFIAIFCALTLSPGMLIASENPVGHSVTDDKKGTSTKNGLVATITIDAGKSRKISDHLFGIFFEDLNYAADGGLYAELIQNRSFEYNPGDKNGWHPLTAWEYTTRGFGYGAISVETKFPVNENNPHYILVNVEEEGQEGVGLTNSGFDGTVIRTGVKISIGSFKFIHR